MKYLIPISFSFLLVACSSDPLLFSNENRAVRMNQELIKSLRKDKEQSYLDLLYFEKIREAD
jgi:uncharacterized protein YcfL